MSRQLICKIEEINITLRKHLAKEEAQLLPLLLQNFSHAEQAELVAQFLYCIPLDTVERVLSWLKPMVPMGELSELMQHLRDVIPDRLLLQLLVTWLNPVPSAAAAAASGSSPAGALTGSSNTSSPTTIAQAPSGPMATSSKLVICPFASATAKQPVVLAAGAAGGRNGSSDGSSDRSRGPAAAGVARATGRMGGCSMSPTAQQWPPLRVSSWDLVCQCVKHSLQ